MMNGFQMLAASMTPKGLGGEPAESPILKMLSNMGLDVPAMKAQFEQIPPMLKEFSDGLALVVRQNQKIIEQNETILRLLQPGDSGELGSESTASVELSARIAKVVDMNLDGTAVGLRVDPNEISAEDLEQLALTGADTREVFH